MCGIYGFCGVQTKKTTKIIKRLGINNITRGRDSTGIAIISKDRTELQKSIVDAVDFYRNNNVLQAISNFRKSDNTIAIGHTRLATHGRITKDNAHPFQIAKVIFAHNGIISNFYGLQDTYKTNFEVDSQIIGYLIATEGMKKAFESISGSFTVPFIMVDDPEVLHVATHNQDFAFAIRDRQMYYSSDMMDLKDALRGQKGFTFCEGGDSLIYTFFDNGKKIDIVKTPFKAKTWEYTRKYIHDWSNERDNKQLTIFDKNNEDMDCNDFQCSIEHEHEYLLNDDNLLVPNPKHQYYKASAYSDDDKSKKLLNSGQIDDYYREFGESYEDAYDTCNRLQCSVKHEHRFLFSKYSDNTWKLIKNPDYKANADDFQKFIEGEMN